MATTIDHLRIDHVIRVIQDFRDAQGMPHRAGEQGLLLALDYDSLRGEISLSWERDGRRETMPFLLACPSGPGNGRMRQYFEMGEYVPAPIEGKRLIPGFGYVPLAPTLPEVRAGVIRGEDRFDEGLDQVWALAGCRRFADADQQLTATFQSAGRRQDAAWQAGQALCARARLHAFDSDLGVYHWLRDRGLQCWYAWGAQATSGGEGSYRAREIRAAERGFVELEEKLGRCSPLK